MLCRISWTHSTSVYTAVQISTAVLSRHHYVARLESTVSCDFSMFGDTATLRTLISNFVYELSRLL